MRYTQIGGGNKMNLAYLRQLRLSKKISLEEMARTIGLSTPGGYSRIETGEVKLKAEHLPKIANKLGINLDDLSKEIFFETELEKNSNKVRGMNHA